MSESLTNINWYPGHMTKAMRMMQEDIKLIDLVIEIIDARIPMSSRNPEIDELGRNKPRMIILNKSDLADPSATDAWMKYFKECNYYAITLDSRKNTGMNKVTDTIQSACKEKIERDRKRGIINRPVRVMVVGIPNVGKSTFINSFTKKACTKVGNKPGVTKGKQWIRLNKNVELLDTPGVLWPKFESQTVGMRLAYIGSINDNIIEKRGMALSFIEFLSERYCKLLQERYNITGWKESYDVLKSVAEIRNCYQKGGELDIDKAAGIIFDDFRSGKLGRITLELPEMIQL